MAVWSDEFVALKRREGYAIQKLCGVKDDYGMITIPWRELCTVTFIVKGEVLVVNDQEKILGKLGKGRFHYSLIDLENKKEVEYKNAAKVEPYDGYIPTKEELVAAGSQKQIKLVSLSDTEFYCISDPTYERIWDGDIYTITEDCLSYEIEPEQLKRLIPINDGITLNNEEQKIHKVVYTDVYDQKFLVSGKIGSQFIVFKHSGFIKHLTKNSQ
jgi:hypothetical protein